jgi:D-arabinose 5-phosphate isomerase GutQ
MEIEISLDWPKVEHEIRELTKTAPEFKIDVIKFCRGMDSEIKKLSEIELQIRRHPTDTLAQKHTRKVKEINDAISFFAQTHLMHLFTRTD